MKPFQINTYESIKNSTVVSTVSITDWLSQIKTSTYSDQIQKARLGELDYEATKAELPCVTYNFLFDKYKKNSNIKDSSGLIYIDIDNPSFDIASLDKSKVYSYYHSFGGVGYAILVKVSGLTIDNFRSTYSSITSELGIAEYIDIHAAKASQFNVLSFDENIYINEDAYTFSSAFAPLSYINKKKEKAYTTEWGANNNPLRFDNLDEIQFDGEYHVNWDGYEYIKCFLPFRNVESNRKTFLFSYCQNLVYLNPSITKERTYTILDSINQKKCEAPLDESELLQVVNSIHNYREKGELIPIYYRKKRKILFNKQSALTRDEKLKICRIELAKLKTELSNEKILGIVDTWNWGRYGAITQRKVYLNHPISKKTIEKYWHLYKPLITTLNNAYKI